MGQMLETDSLSQAEISKLEFMVGKWKGSGWIMERDRQKKSFDQTEDIQFKLDKTFILIEGAFKTDGKISHNALAVISYVDILHHLKEMDSFGFYEARGSTSLRVPAGSCCRPLMRFA